MTPKKGRVPLNRSEFERICKILLPQVSAQAILRLSRYNDRLVAPNRIRLRRCFIVGRKFSILVLMALVAIASNVGAAPAYKGMSYTSFGTDVLSSPDSDQSLLN